jgi:serine/threonine protein kinase
VILLCIYYLCIYTATAPGKARSPEEYAYEDLTEKLDIFAGGNVFYEILTGRNPWNYFGNSAAKKLIMQGVKPNFSGVSLLASPTESLESESTDPIDQALFQLILRMYEKNPTQRISATELVAELEKIAKLYNLPILV